MPEPESKPRQGKSVPEKKRKKAWKPRVFVAFHGEKNEGHVGDLTAKGLLQAQKNCEAIAICNQYGTLDIAVVVVGHALRYVQMREVLASHPEFADVETVMCHLLGEPNATINESADGTSRVLYAPDLSIDKAHTLQLTDILPPKEGWKLADRIARKINADQLWCAGRQMGKLFGLNPLPRSGSLLEVHFDTRQVTKIIDGGEGEINRWAIHLSNGGFDGNHGGN
ncbi:hypothetical protein KW786_01635 [Candidatus Parcubacteria bacterium]|nr:hypothetical protein [Candidatus Parcubacteria bacterium]